MHSSPPRPIRSALATAGTNQPVTITGRATAGAGQMQRNAFEVAVQDVSGGLRVFSRVVDVAVREGDSLLATGTIKHYRGDVELVATRVTVVPGTPRIVPPRELPIDVAEISRYPGQLVRVRGRVDGFGTSEGGQWLRLRDSASARGAVTINHGAPIDLSKARPNDSLTVAGIVTSFKDNADDPVVWQLVPRTENDVVISSATVAWPAWLLGVAGEDALVGRSISDFATAESLDAVQGLSTVAEGERPPRVRGRLLKSTGATLDVEISSSPCVYHDRPAVVVLARDITSQLRNERDLHALALIDELTGLHNRRGFTPFADQEIARARRSGRMPVLVFADLDDLKGINDMHGHATGDAAIRLVATAFKSILRESDIVARWSGDEFVALLSDGDPGASEQIADRLAAAIASQSPTGVPYAVSATVGTSSLGPILSLHDAIERADAELYTRKRRARRSRPSALAGVDAVTERQ